MKVKIVSAVCSVAVVLCAFAAALWLPRRATARIGSSPAGGSSAVSSYSAPVSESVDSQSLSSDDESQPVVKSFEQINSAAQSAAQGYTVKTYEGKIAIFKDGSDVPDQVSDLDPSTLPQSEADRLGAGIHADSRDDALRILENMTS